MLSRIVLATLVCIFMTGSLAFGASPVGRWKGQWTSTATGHSGALRARIRQIDPDTYRAVFAGRFAKVVPFVYPAKLQRVRGTRNTYTSSTRLPLLGEYRMTAHVSSRHFNARFTGRRDSGQFRMSR